MSVWQMNGVHTFFGDLLACQIKMLADGEGGTYVAWTDSCSHWETIGGALYIQHFDSRGSPLWGESGKIVVPVSGIGRSGPCVCSDGAGGLIVGWTEIFDRKKNYITMQRLNSEGDILWQENGKSIFNGKEVYLIDLVPSSNGKTIIIFAEETGMAAQMIDGNGDQVWANRKTYLTSATSTTGWTRTHSDNNGGVVLVWLDFRNDPGKTYYNADIFAQRIDVDGNIIWQDNGIPICTADYNQSWPDCCTYADGSAIFTWGDYREYYYGNIYAQKIDPQGNLLWPLNGIAIAPEQGSQREPVIVSDGEDGAIITWEDWGYGDQACSQRIDGNGNALWGPNGVLVSPLGSVHIDIETVKDDNGGVIVIWKECSPLMRYGSYMPLFISAQHLDSNGNRLWTVAGMPVESRIRWNPQGPDWFYSASDGKGGAIVTWVETGSNNQTKGLIDLYSHHVYTQRISDDFNVTRKSFGHYDGTPELAEKDWDNGDKIAVLIDPGFNNLPIEPLSVEFLSECGQSDIANSKLHLLSYENGLPGEDLIPPISGWSGQCWYSVEIPTGTVLNDKFFVAIDMGPVLYPPKVPDILMDDSPGNYSFFYDSSTASWTKYPYDFYIRLVADTKLPLITSNTLKNGTIGKTYSDMISFEGGIAPSVFVVSSGVLPPGLQLNPSTGEIFGICLTVGKYDFSVTLTDTVNNSFTGSFSINIEGDTPLSGFMVYPNPFKSALNSLKIKYYLTENMNGNIYIYNISGEKIRSISINEGYGGAIGVNTIEWDGRNNYGEECASGVYILLLDIKNDSTQISRKVKVALIK